MKLTRTAGLFAACAFLIALSGCDFAFPAAEGKFDRTLNVTGAVDLDVSTGSGRIEVRAGGSSMVQIYGIIRAGDDWHSNAQEKVRYLESHPPIEQTGNVIRIGRINDTTYNNNVSISYEIVVPATTRVRSNTGSGSIEVEGVRGPVDAGTGSGSIALSNIGSDVNAHTGSGSIKLEGVSGVVEVRTGSGSIGARQIAGSVRAQTSSGGITLGQTGAESGGTRDADLSTGSGSIEVSGVDGSLHAKTRSGGITASGTPAGDWELDATSGSINLRLNPNAAFDLVAHSSSGRIGVDHPVTMMGTFGKHDMRGRVRGGGHLIDVRTGSGSITIQ